MTTITYSAARKEFASIIKRVLDHRDPVTITKKEGKVVMMPLEDWEAWQETVTCCLILTWPKSWRKALRNLKIIATSYASLRKNLLKANNDYRI